MSIAEQVIEQLKQMDDIQQERLLNFARILTKTPLVKGEAGASIIKATGFFDLQSLNEIEAAIAEGCEEIDWRNMV